LNHYLRDFSEQTKFKLTWKQVINWLIQTVSGVSVLHGLNPPLVHRDIKSLNLLLDADWKIKVCDFGLSRFRTMTNLSTLVGVRGTMAYCPPEIYDSQIFSTQSDIYSIGMVIWEVVSTRVCGKYEVPFSQFPDITYDFQILVQAFKEKLRPTIPPLTPPILSNLIEVCWQQDVSMRPSCPALLEKLTAIKNALLPCESEEDSSRVLQNLSIT